MSQPIKIAFRFSCTNLLTVMESERSCVAISFRKMDAFVDSVFRCSGIKNVTRNHLARCHGRELVSRAGFWGRRSSSPFLRRTEGMESKTANKENL